MECMFDFRVVEARGTKRELRKAFPGKSINSHRSWVQYGPYRRFPRFSYSVSVAHVDVVGDHQGTKAEEIARRVARETGLETNIRYFARD